ncbi:hypothetical protein Poli38472_005505 [Pythium oligandrum]|uniref:Uncharacterized protein n=1 Tax=Pythium oligandrum TaxID=41045 RepID=A0A8K1CGF0_PYTOL|nr:hypothetical protein Poli38472_005505 [Pythium oligandrum]|eukprot:TMW62887.1 hypothetical protein Poli38472_005505 [Pythium oligandrum]
MVATVVRAALRAQAVRTALQHKKVAAPVAQASLVRWMSTGGKRGGKKSEDDLYDPYKLYQDEHGKPGYREFNPDMLDDMDDFVWEESEELMADKSWPMTSGTEMFTDLLNVSPEPLAQEKLDLVLQEFYRRVEHKSLDDIKLPEISVEVPSDDPDKEALEIMKLSLLNNGRIKLDDKNEIMESLIDELNHLRKDQTTLFKDLE